MNTKHAFQTKTWAKVGFMPRMFVFACKGADAVMCSESGKWFHVTAHRGVHRCNSQDEAWTSFGMATGCWGESGVVMAQE